MHMGVCCQICYEINFKDAYELLNLRALKISALYESDVFEWMC